MTNKQQYQPIKVTLQVPKELDGKLVESVTMRPPKAADVIAAHTSTNNDIGRDVLLFANLTDTTPEFIGAMEFYDYKLLEQANDCFLVPVSAHLERRSSYFANPVPEQSQSSNSEASQN